MATLGNQFIGNTKPFPISPGMRQPQPMMQNQGQPSAINEGLVNTQVQPLMQQQPQQPQYGLSGAENALQGGCKVA